MKPLLRAGTFHLRRRVPARYAAVEPRAHVWVSLATDSPTEAARKAEAAWGALLESWEARLAGSTDEAEARYAAAVRLAQAKGFRYVPVAELAAGPLDEIIARVAAVSGGSVSGGSGGRGKAGGSIHDARAVLGLVPKPAITVTKALALYWEITRPRLRGKSEDQVRRWKNPRKRAVANFTAQIGDRVLAEITPDDMQDFRDWWAERVDEEDLAPESANKDIGHLAEVLRSVNKAKRLRLDLPLAGWMIPAGEKRTRPAFSTPWIRDRLLAPGALAGLNTEARCLLLGMVNTGYRPSEGLCLGRAQIRLDAEIPHISIEPVGRTLKSQYARRTIPLLGVSLAAFQACPGGFARYAKGGDAAAVIINRYLRARALKESDEHVLYSLRHSFQERMIGAGVDDRVRRDVFGHTLTEERYGEVPLETKKEAMGPLAL